VEHLEELRRLYLAHKAHMTIRERVAFAVAWIGFQLLRLARWISR